MNTFKFIGTIPKPKEKNSIIRTISNGKKYLKLIINQNENNSAFIQMYGDNLFNGSIPVFLNSKNRTLIKLYMSRRLKNKRQKYMTI